MNKYKEQTRHFLKHETQFHLGMLPTEQSHPKTRSLSQTLQRDTAAGIRMLQAVDDDVAASAKRVLAGGEYEALLTALLAAFRNGHRVCFSGCGATGRLSILIESCWRRFWIAMAEQHTDCASICAGQADQVCSIMTAGDYALIRSVEFFEDYEAFGRRQVVEAGLGQGDVLVAISEGGETSSVIGTILEAKACGAQAFFVFNNPAEILAAHIERSRQVIEDPDIIILDLASGPMAVAGSTRMQATTGELLVVGAAMDHALSVRLNEVLPPAVLAACPFEWRSPRDGVACFSDLLADLSTPTAVASMAEWTDTECSLYSDRGRVTYFADECLLDIFTDATERAPTFMLPPFRKCDDFVSPPSWAFVKNPAIKTPSAWSRALGRLPRCLDWDAALYVMMKGPASAQLEPPRLDSDEIVKFLVGNEDDPSRYDAPDSVAMAVVLDDEAFGPAFPAWWQSFTGAAQPYRRRLAASIGTTPPVFADTERTFHIPCRLTSTPLGLWRRLATKLVLNTVSTATMGCFGRLSGNWMANVETSNKKLIDRGTRLVSELTGTDYETACYALHQTMQDMQTSPEEGSERLSPVAMTIQRIQQGAAIASS